MRFLPADISNRVSQRIQTVANSNAPELNAWIWRPVSPLKNKKYLQMQDIDVDSVTAVDIAVRHPRLGRESDVIYIAYISNGKARCVYSDYEHRMSRHFWSNLDFNEDASDISICFDGDMPKDANENVEFVSSGTPWFFWVKDGVCYAKQLNSNRQTDILVDSGCTKVDSIRSVICDYGAFDFGLCVFMIINNQLFYKQYIDGTWYDAVLVSAFSEDTLVDVSVSRTFDYRIAVQVKTSTGAIKELFTQYQGIAKQNSEHLNAYITAEGTLYNLEYITTVEKEHLSATITTESALYVIGVVTILQAYNSEVDGNYGKKVTVIVDKEISSNGFANSYNDWTLTDSLGNEFYPKSVSLGSDGTTITMNFTNFNAAVGTCTIGYSGSSLKFPANVTITSIANFSFTPTGLAEDPPAVATVTSMSATETDGTEIEIVFDQNLDATEISSNTDYFTVSIDEYDYEGGTLYRNARTVTAVTLRDNNKVVLTFAAGNVTSIQNAETVYVTYDGHGTLHNSNGDVKTFTQSFVPTGMTKQLGQHESEHLNASISVEATLYTLEYHDRYDNEHLNATITATGVCTHIDDL